MGGTDLGFAHVLSNEGEDEHAEASDFAGCSLEVLLLLFEWVGGWVGGWIGR